jgi:hypothetical protein
MGMKPWHYQLRMSVNGRFHSHAAVMAGSSRVLERVCTAQNVGMQINIASGHLWELNLCSPVDR